MEALRKVYLDTANVPKETRRRALEAGVRAPQDWHPDAVRIAHESSDEEWKLTAVFCMRRIHGFEKEILEGLESRNPDIHVEAVQSAGVRELNAAWPHVKKLVTSKQTAKPLLLAAIIAVACIRPHEAATVLAKLAKSRDQEIAETAREAILESTVFEHDDDWDEEDEPFQGTIH